MSLAEIKQQVRQLTPAERDELALQLKVLRDLEEPGFLAEITEAHAQAEAGERMHSRAELIARMAKGEASE